MRLKASATRPGDLPLLLWKQILKNILDDGNITSLGKKKKKKKEISNKNIYISVVQCPAPSPSCLPGWLPAGHSIPRTLTCGQLWDTCRLGQTCPQHKAMNSCCHCQGTALGGAPSLRLRQQPSVRCRLVLKTKAILTWGGDFGQRLGSCTRASQEGHGHKQRGLWALLQAELVLPKSTTYPD